MNLSPIRRAGATQFEASTYADWSAKAQAHDVRSGKAKWRETDASDIYDYKSIARRVATLRAPDFYGPGVTQSHLGDMAFGALARGKTAQLAAPADVPHDFAYVPDIGCAVVMLLDAPDGDFGQVWHMPCAPTQSTRQILALGTGGKPRILSIPLALLPLLGLAVPMLREMAEMRFQWDRPYHVDARRFTQRFGLVPTPFAIGAVETARSFAGRAAVDVFGAAQAA